MRMTLSFALAASLAFALPASAADPVPTETAELEGSLITLHLHPFLTEEELAVLRTILTSKEALELFMPGQKGHAAIAVAPEDGFIRDGAPPPSAIALADFPDSDTARAETIKACDAARKSATPCVAVLEIAPK